MSDEELEEDLLDLEAALLNEEGTFVELDELPGQQNQD